MASREGDRGRFRALADGRVFSVRVTPGAGRDQVTPGPEGGADLLVRVTAPPEGGKANRAVTALLARALGVPKTRLVLVRGAGGRDKLFRVD